MRAVLVVEEGGQGRLQEQRLVEAHSRADEFFAIGSNDFGADDGAEATCAGEAGERVGPVFVRENDLATMSDADSLRGGNADVDAAFAEVVGYA